MPPRSPVPKTLALRSAPAKPDAPAPSAMALHDEPGHLIRRAHQLAVSTFHETHGRDVTPVQYAVLRALQNEPGIDQVTLAQRVALDTSTTADIATRLESKGWVERVLLARRQRSLHLTPAGEAILSDMLPRVEPMYQLLLQGLSPEEQADLVRLLRKFVHLCERSDAKAPPVGSSGKP
jgi:MarR family transcriptional regulator, temperature-dependent positive regulator of motility